MVPWLFEGMVTSYVSNLSDLDRDKTRAAAMALVRTSKWMPTIAEIREMVVQQEHGRKRPGAEAWGDVQKAIKAKGVYRTPGVDFFFDDPLVAKAVGALGWTSLCNSELQGPDRARFIELYDSYDRAARTDAQLSAGATSSLAAGRAAALVASVASKIKEKS